MVFRGSVCWGRARETTPVFPTREESGLWPAVCKDTRRRCVWRGSKSKLSAVGVEAPETPPGLRMGIATFSGRPLALSVASRADRNCRHLPLHLHAGGSPRGPLRKPAADPACRRQLSHLGRRGHVHRPGPLADPLGIEEARAGSAMARPRDRLPVHLSGGETHRQVPAGIFGLLGTGLSFDPGRGKLPRLASHFADRQLQFHDTRAASGVTPLMLVRSWNTSRVIVPRGNIHNRTSGPIEFAQQAYPFLL